MFFDTFYGLVEKMELHGRIGVRINYKLVD